MDRYFKKEHDKAFGEGKSPKLNDLALPDSGSGRYATQLSYRKWFILNSWMRSQGNGNEYIFQMILFTLISGIKNPYHTCFIAAMYIPARFFYTIGYISSPYERFLGFIMSILFVMLMFVGTLITIIPLMK